MFPTMSMKVSVSWKLFLPHAVKRAARLFHRDGFVVVKDVLTPEQTQRLRDTCKVDKYQGWNQPSRSDTYHIFCRKIKEILVCN